MAAGVGGAVALVVVVALALSPCREDGAEGVAEAVAEAEAVVQVEVALVVAAAAVDADGPAALPSLTTWSSWMMMRRPVA